MEKREAEKTTDPIRRDKRPIRNLQRKLTRKQGNNCYLFT